MKTDLSRSGLGSRLGMVWAILVLVGITIGCDSGGGTANPLEGMTEDQKAVEMLVGSVADKSGNLPALRGLYTTEAAPSSADAKKFNAHMFSIDGDIAVEGSTATFDVLITKIPEDGVPVSKTWKAAKDGDSWKLTETPLP